LQQEALTEITGSHARRVEVLHAQQYRQQCIVLHIHIDSEIFQAFRQITALINRVDDQLRHIALVGTEVRHISLPAEIILQTLTVTAARFKIRHIFVRTTART
jgi:hypothetical protein